MICLLLLTSVFSHLATYSMGQPLLPEWGAEISLGKRKEKVWAEWCLEVSLACHEFPVSYLAYREQCYQKERGKSFERVYSRRWHPGFYWKPISVRNVQESYLFALGNKGKAIKITNVLFLSATDEFSAPQSRVCVHHCLLVYIVSFCCRGRMEKHQKAPKSPSCSGPGLTRPSSAISEVSGFLFSPIWILYPWWWQQLLETWPQQK